MARSGDLHVGLECYDPESNVFPRLARRQERQDMTPRDVLLILKWKLGRITDFNSKTVNAQNMDRINQAVRDAAAPETETKIRALKKLSSVPGIRLATAAAILTVCYPNDFTIIDWRVLDQLKLAPATTDGWTAKEYFELFLPAVRQWAEARKCSLRDADRALWGLSVNERIEHIERLARSSLA